MKRRTNSDVRTRPQRAQSQRQGPRSPKAIEIVALVQALSGTVGNGNGADLGKRIAGLLAGVYGRRGTTPTWAKELIAHYTARTDGS